MRKTHLALSCLFLMVTACGGGGGGGAATDAPVAGSPVPAQSPSPAPAPGPAPAPSPSPSPAPSPSPTPSQLSTPFSVGGVTYSAEPVSNGTVTGFGWGPGGQGVNDGEAAGARVWYASSNCVTFRMNGTGVLDARGGTATTIDSFPHLPVIAGPGTLDIALPRMRGYSKPVQQHPDPAYDRRSELRPFVWGVRLKADGTVHRDSRGHTIMLMRFADGSTQASGWDPVANAPVTALSSGDGNLITGEQAVTNALRAHVDAQPTTSHFCYFREATSQQLQPLCLDNAVSGSAAGGITGTRRLCYDKGQLNGAYVLTGQDGRVRESGFFENNRPVDGWGFWSDAGTQAASGRFTKAGVPTGEWTFHDSAGRPQRQVPYTGVYTPSGRTPLLRILDGLYTERFYTGSNAYETGTLAAGLKSGPWKTHAPTTLDSADGTMVVKEEVWDPSSPVSTGTFCYATGDCVPTVTSRLASLRTYKWVATCPLNHPWMQEVRYGSDGRPTSTTCYRITGTPRSSSVTALPSCPAASCQ